MPLHFTKSEFERRRQLLLRRLQEADLGAILLFKPESMYYLTGYDSTGFIVFQCMVITADGRITLMTRSPDVAQARYSSDIEDVRVWVDGASANPALNLRDIMAEHGLAGSRVGIELNTFGLNARRWQDVERAMDGFCTLVDMSDLVNDMRVVKSDEEIAYVRRAAELADEALAEAFRLAAPGVSEGELYAAMHGAVFRGGGFYPASRYAIGSGKKALLVRTTCDTGVISNNDQLQMEFAGAYRHYHAGMMRTLLTGKVRDEHRSMHAACVDALAASQAACRPGGTVGDIFAAHARTFDDAGFRDCRFNACGYSMGATYAPSWMDHPMIFADNPRVLEPNMVFFLLMILVDPRRELTMSIGETVRVTTSGCERLSAATLDLPTA